MLPTGLQDSGSAQSAPPPPTSKSKKNKKRKNKSANTKVNGETALQNGNGHIPGQENTSTDQDNTGSDDDLDSPQVEETHESSAEPTDADELSTNGVIDISHNKSNGISMGELTERSVIEDERAGNNVTVSDTERKLEAAVKRGNQLREEVIELRKELENLQQRHDASQQKHEDEVANLSARMEAQDKTYKDVIAEANAQLQSTQQQHEANIAGDDDRLEQTRQEHNEKIVALNHTHEINQKRLEDAAQRRLDEETAKFHSSIEETRQRNDVEIANLNARLEHDTIASKTRHEDIQRQHNEEMNSMNIKLEDDRKRHEADVAKFNMDLKESSQRHAEEVAMLSKELEGSKKRHDEELSGANTRFENTRLQHKEDISAFNKQLADNEKHYEEDITRANTSLTETRKKHDEEVASLNTQLEENQKHHDVELLGVRNQLEDLQKRYDDNAGGSSARLEEYQQRHEDELAALNARLEESQTAKEHAETQYQKLLGKVNTIKTQLGERLKADAADLSQARVQIEELEEQNRIVTENNQALQAQVGELSSETEQKTEELTDLRTRANLSQQNWAKERDDLFMREAQLKEEFESAKQAMQDWEVLAMEERSIREGLGDRVSELEEQLSNQRESYERAASERDTQSVTVDGLQRALHDIQEARKVELREIVENTQVQLEELRRQLKVAQESATSSQSTLESTRQELEKALPFEREVKEKNLLIGKLRHEAVILNDHLTKALRFLKRAKPEETVDRQLVTNHFLQFLSLDRSDPKKFQILQLISALLAWNEEQNEAAGLARPGASSQPINPNSSLRVPLSPFLRRVSSTTSVNHPPMNLNSIFTTNSPLSPTAESGTESPGKESLADLWNGFLERESATRGNSVEPPDMHSRQSSFGNGRKETLISPTSGTSTPRYGGYSLRGSRSPSMSGGNNT